MNYKFIAKSKNDPNGEKGGLGFHILEQAQLHCNIMNRERMDYPNGWNTEFWKILPEEWEIEE